MANSPSKLPDDWSNRFESFLAARTFNEPVGGRKLPVSVNLKSAGNSCTTVELGAVSDMLRGRILDLNR